VQDDTQERTVDLKAAIVFDEAHFLELVHEKIESGARGPDRFRQRPLRCFWKNSLRLIFLSVASQQQNSASEPFLCSVEQLISTPS